MHIANTSEAPASLTVVAALHSVPAVSHICSSEYAVPYTACSCPYVVDKDSHLAGHRAYKHHLGDDTRFLPFLWSN